MVGRRISKSLYFDFHFDIVATGTPKTSARYRDVRAQFALLASLIASSASLVLDRASARLFATCFGGAFRFVHHAAISIRGRQRRLIDVLSRVFQNYFAHGPGSGTFDGYAIVTIRMTCVVFLMRYP